MRRAVPRVSLALALATACAGSAGSDPVGEATAPEAACDRLFDAMTAASCGAPPLTADVLRTMRVRHRSSCVARLALPGTSLTAARLDACLAAARSLPCGARERPAECVVRPGALADGAACEDDAQCASTRCARAFGSPADGGAVVVPTCGRCTPAGRAGEPCGGHGGAGGDFCVDGTACEGVGAERACAVVTYGAIGEACDGAARQCKDGSVCDPDAGRCAAGGASAGAVAGASAGAGTGAGAGAGAGASASAGASVSASAGAGAGAWARPGEACGGAVACEVGSCPGARGVCPRVLSDGAPCVAFDRSATCDAFAACTGGRCTVEYAAGCP